jgi:hypothetical protein
MAGESRCTTITDVEQTGHRKDPRAGVGGTERLRGRRLRQQLPTQAQHGGAAWSGEESEGADVKHVKLL